MPNITTNHAITNTNTLTLKLSAYFTFPSPFFVGYKNPTHYPLSFSSIFIFERILFWMNQGFFYSFSDENSRKRCVNLKMGFLKF